MTAKQIHKQQEKSADASPAKSLVSDLMQLRRTLRATGRAYLQRLESEPQEIQTWAKARSSEPPKAEVRDLADMVTLVRKLEVKPQKGRRKYLKKIDATIAEMRELLDLRQAR
jgi:hypothetical protein